MDFQNSSSSSHREYSNKPAQNTQSEEGGGAASHGVPKDWKFWCIIFSLALSVLLTAVEFVSRPRSLFLAGLEPGSVGVDKLGI